MTDNHRPVLGKYRLLERIGEGGMGTVYRARDDMLDREVAIKVLRPDLVRQPTLVERFRTEAIALARLAHPRIATLYGLERDGDELYMVMEFVSGETLEALVRREGKLSWRRAVTICAAVADALDHAHDHGVVHRDIKPANIMITPGDQVKVMDFGIARMAGSSRQTQHGHAVGTPAYMAPEQLRGEVGDGRTDLYALGAVCYELITGRIAFDADSDYQRLMQQMHQPPPVPSASQPDVPAVIDRAVRRALAKEPTQRFASAAAMRGALLAATEAVTRDRNAVDSRSAAVALVALRRVAARLGDELGKLPRALLIGAGATVGLVILLLAWPRTTSQVAPPADDAAPRPAAPRPSGPIAGGDVGRGPIETARFVPPPPAPVQPQPPRVGRAAPATPVPQPEAKPQPAPVAASTEATGAADSSAIQNLVRTWIAATAQRKGPGLDGFLAGQSAAVLVREGRLSIEPAGPAAIVITGGRATATVTTGVQVRSAFGASKKLRGRFRFTLTADERATWRITRVTVAE